MRILQIMPDFELAGAETMCENLVNELYKKNEVAVISFFSKKTEITNRLENKGIKIYFLGKRKGPQFTLIKKISKVINEYKPDIIHTHRYCLEYTYPAIKISKYKNVKIIHTVHNIAKKEVPFIRRLVRKLFINKKKVTYVAISEIIKDTICSEYNLDESLVPIVLNGINLDNCIIKKDYTLRNTLINIGRLSEQKNQQFLIEVFEKIHRKYTNYKLKIIGAGPLENELMELVKKYNLENSVIFEKNKPSCYQDLNEADIFVMTSKWEGLPMTIIEAMGTGVPVVSSNVGGISNMIDNDESGYLLDLNVDEFYYKIISLIEKEEIRERIGKHAIKKSLIFSAKNMANNYIKIYKGSSLNEN